MTVPYLQVWAENGGGLVGLLRGPFDVRMPVVVVLKHTAVRPLSADPTRVAYQTEFFDVRWRFSTRGGYAVFPVVTTRLSLEELRAVPRFR